MVRIEMQLTEEEVAIIEQIAKEEGRSRKKQCEVYLRKMISDYKRKQIMCNIVVINKGEKEINTPRQFLEHFHFMPDTDVYLGKVGMDECLCNCDVEDTFNFQKVEFKKSGGDIYVGLLDEVTGDDD